MNTYDTLRLKFESPLWARAPQIAVIDSILEERPDFVIIVEIEADEVLNIKEFTFVNDCRTMISAFSGAHKI